MHRKGFHYIPAMNTELEGSDTGNGEGTMILKYVIRFQWRGLCVLYAGEQKNSKLAMVRIQHLPVRNKVSLTKSGNAKGGTDLGGNIII